MFHVEHKNFLTLKIKETMIFPPRTKKDLVDELSKIEKENELMETKKKGYYRLSKEHRFYNRMVSINLKKVKLLTTYAASNGWL